jgi:hypothetical protein
MNRYLNKEKEVMLRGGPGVKGTVSEEGKDYG